jgi:DNA excision repair protein ERCC-2
MKFYIDELPVYFPFEMMYKEQYEYMTQIKKALDMQSHAILEMPTGTGKTVCLLSIFTSYT